MRHLEFHILQSVPVSCLNRDDLNSPKTAIFGGVKRARVSSQCWKRAIRKYAKEKSCFFKGERTKLLAEMLEESLKKIEGTSLDEEAIRRAAIDLARALVEKKKDGDNAQGEDSGSEEDTGNEFSEEIAKAENSSSVRTATLLYMSPGECDWIAKDYCQRLRTCTDGKNNIGDTIAAFSNEKDMHCEDAADIALFGRMLASHPKLNVEGAAMFNHALSTHGVTTEIDYLTAMDDRNPKGRQASDMIVTLEFQSATYYRFVAVNLDLLVKQGPLKALTNEQRSEIMKVFAEAVIMAMPEARQNSMNGNTLPGYVLAIYRESGHPLQLVNAFEQPVRYNGEGLLKNSKAALKKELEYVENNWGIKSDKKWEFEPAGSSFAQFLAAVADSSIVNGREKETDSNGQN